MSDLGDRALGSTITFQFTTAVNGVPTALAGTPAISVYGSNSSTPITAGVTFTGSYNSTTGLNNVAIAATSGNGYAAGTDYSVVVTTGTLGGVSMVGYQVGTFSLGLGNTSNIAGSASAATNLSAATKAIGRGTVGSSSSTTSITTSAFAPSGVDADQFAGRVVLFDATTATANLRGESAVISASTASATPTFTVPALTTAPSSGDTFSVI